MNAIIFINLIHILAIVCLVFARMAALISQTQRGKPALDDKNSFIYKNRKSSATLRCRFSKQPF